MNQDEIDDLVSTDAGSLPGNFLAFLERCENGTEPSPTRLPRLWHRRMFHWSADDLRETVRLAEANASVNVLSVDETPEYCTETATRIACILRSFRNARELVLRPSRRHRDDGTSGVDAILRGMLGSEAPLRALRMFVAGGDKEMFDFLHRFSTISTIELGSRDRPLKVSEDLVAAFAAHWAGGESKLEHASLHCCRTSVLDMARLLYPLGHCSLLRVLDVTLPDPAVLLDVCFVCAASPLIEQLAVSFALGGDRYANDLSPLLWYRRDFPDSLRSLSLRNCWLRLSNYSRRLAVYKVTSLDLVSCDEALPSLLLEKFPNLERLHMGAEDDEIDDGRIPYSITDMELDKFARALPQTKVTELALHLLPREHLPSLVALLQNARGSIDLTFHYFKWTNVDNVRRGLEAMNPAVTRLGLRFVECREGDAGYAQFLQVLMGSGRPSALESLTMQLNPAIADLRHTCDALRAILPMSSLRALEILQVNASAYEFVAESCLAGLEQNRALQELRLDASQPNDNSGEFVLPAAIVSRLHEVLKSNGVLGEFGGGQFDLSDPMVAKVAFLLKQNRLGRRVLLDAASPAGLWPLVLSLVSKAGAADVMFHYLRAAETGVLCRRPLLPPQTFAKTFKMKRPRSDSIAR